MYMEIKRQLNEHKKEKKEQPDGVEDEAKKINYDTLDVLEMLKIDEQEDDFDPKHYQVKLTAI